MKIAILGANGFVGSSTVKYLTKLGYDVSPITRKTLDLLDCREVKLFLKSNFFDVIIDCAATMTDENNLYDTRNNLGLFMNFYENSELFGKFINMGSGAEYDRMRNIDNATEETIFNVLPNDSYGFGQNIKSRLCFKKDNFYNLRIFNCFGLGEIKTRIFPKMIESKIKIYDDRYFDYFCVKDLCSVVDNCINSSWDLKDINCVYSDKFKISEVANKFCRYQNLDYSPEVISTSDKNYTGDATLLNSLGIKLFGLEHGLENYFEEV